MFCRCDAIWGPFRGGRHWWVSHLYGSLEVPPEDKINQEEKTRKGFKKTRRQLDKILDLVKSTSSERECNKTRSWISSSRLDEDEKTRRQEPGSRQVDLMRMRRQEDKIRSLIWSSQIHEDEKKRRRDTEYDRQVEMTKSWRSLSSRLLILIKSTWRDPGSCLLVLSPHQVDLTKSGILSSCLFVLKTSTWWDRGSCLFVFSPGPLVFLTPFLIFLVFSSRLLFLIYLVFWGHF